MKESEAKTKVCPFIRFSILRMDGFASTAINSHGMLIDNISESPKWALCVGSDCMMWQTTSDKSCGWCGLTR